MESSLESPLDRLVGEVAGAAVGFPADALRFRFDDDRWASKALSWLRCTAGGGSTLLRPARSELRFLKTYSP